jgi:hypothetical protein
MKHFGGLIVFTVASLMSHATTVAPYAAHCRLLERVVEKSQPDVSLALLQSVALGRADDFRAEVEKRVGLAAGQLRAKEFATDTVRACAFQRIGELGSEEAVAFLTKVSRSDIGPDMTHQIWAAVQIALRNLVFMTVNDDLGKRVFLENVLTQPHDGTGALWMWAINQLCDRGSVLSTGVIQKSMKTMWSGSYGDEEMRFCTQRMEVVARHADRAKAIGSIVRVADATDDRLITWGIYQLAAIGTPSADAELRRFATEVDKAMSGSLGGLRWKRFREEIQDVLTSRIESEK